MAFAWFPKAVERLMNNTLNLATATIKAAAIDAQDADTALKAIVSSTNNTPIVMTITGHGWSNGDVVIVQDHLTNTNANGIRRIANVTANTFELTDPDSSASIAGNGVGGATGWVLNLSLGTTGVFFSDINAGHIGTAVALVAKTVVKGVFDANDFTFPTISGDQFEAIVFFEDTGTASTSICICVHTNGTNLPFTPSGVDCNVLLSAITGVGRLGYG